MTEGRWLLHSSIAAVCEKGGRDVRVEFSRKVEVEYWQKEGYPVEGTQSPQEPLYG